MLKLRGGEPESTRGENPLWGHALTRLGVIVGNQPERDRIASHRRERHSPSHDVPHRIAGTLAFLPDEGAAGTLDRVSPDLSHALHDSAHGLVWSRPCVRGRNEIGPARGGLHFTLARRELPTDLHLEDVSPHAQMGACPDRRGFTRDFAASSPVHAYLHHIAPRNALRRSGRSTDDPLTSPVSCVLDLDRRRRVRALPNGKTARRSRSHDPGHRKPIPLVELRRVFSDHEPIDDIGLAEPRNASTELARWRLSAHNQRIIRLDSDASRICAASFIFGLGRKTIFHGVGIAMPDANAFDFVCK